MRVPGFGEISRLVHRANEIVREHDADAREPNVLSVCERMTSSDARIAYLLDNLKLGGTEILRIKTPLDQQFSLAHMAKFVDLLADSSVWGVNMGEFCATDAAWRLFGNELHRTSIGFAWLNERGKANGASADTHEWLLGVGKYRDGGVLRGRNSPLSKNRLKVPASQRPWFDPHNPTVHAPVAHKFLFNPHNSIYYGMT